MVLSEGLVGVSWVGIRAEDSQFLFISCPLLSNFAAPFFFLVPFLKFNVGDVIAMLIY